ncbi:hypothetical protein H0W26_04775, partial [Candidatus Dependentiae bacterium]|nr:hypothetical protein [Candidatus Dependentiae bacterium]
MASLRKNVLLFILCCYSSISLDIYSMESSLNIENKFKIGFEFQESTHLCGWAKDNKNFQKVPLYEVWNIQDKKLCYHVEIDGDDIEFVTRPFANDEEEQLAACITSIKYTLEVLKNLFCHYSHPANVVKGEENNQVSVTFKEWIIELCKFLAEDGVYEIYFVEEEIKNRTGLALSEMTLAFPKKEMGKSSSSSFEQSFHWSPFFVPQVTFQHPIELAIPLYLTLFGDVSSLLMSLPHKNFLDSLLQAAKFNWNQFENMYVNKESALIFLHAFTLLRMVPAEEKVEIVKNGNDRGVEFSLIDKLQEVNALTLDKMLLQKTLDQHRECRQIDIKGRLVIMSRKPFSELYAEIIKSDIHIKDEDEEDRPPFESDNSKVSYKDVFLSAMHEYGYSSFEKHMVLFSKVNYGEQFFLSDGTPADLTDFNKYITDEFKKDNADVLNTLLKEGIVTTVMLRNFNDDI